MERNLELFKEVFEGASRDIGKLAEHPQPLGILQLAFMDQLPVSWPVSFGEHAIIVLATQLAKLRGFLTWECVFDFTQ
jgi:hypothetical protein